MPHPFTKAEVASVSWSHARSVNCPYCDASKRRTCRVVKMSENRQRWSNNMSNFHIARKVQFLYSGMYIIREELDITDLVA